MGRWSRARRVSCLGWVLAGIVAAAPAARAGSYEQLHLRLLEAVEAGDAARVEELLLDGASPDYIPRSFRNRPCRVDQSFDAWSPFVLVAANHGHLGVLKLLAEYGAEIDAQQRVCAGGEIEKGGTALMASLVNGQGEAVRYLLEMGADTEVEEQIYGATALLQLAGATRGEGYAGSALEAADLQALDRLLAANADLEKEDALGRTALWLAAAAGKVEMVRALLAAGARTFVEAPCSGDRSGQLCTPRRVAERRKHWEVLGLFEAAAAASR